jgi:hypothetical protein
MNGDIGFFFFFFFDFLNRKNTYLQLDIANSFVQVADKIRARVDTYTQAFPAILEIPSKEHPYGTYFSSACLNYMSIVCNASAFFFFFFFFFSLC